MQRNLTLSRQSSLPENLMVDPNNASRPTGNDHNVHLERVAQRWAEIDTVGRERLDGVQDRLSKRVSPVHRRAVLDQALKSPTTRQRMHWMRQEIKLVHDAVIDDSACRRGCSHCCHIGVLVAEPEAQRISKETGIPLQEPTPKRTLHLGQLLESPDSAATAYEITTEFGMSNFGRACTFLKEGGCSIYAHRPIACRQLFNLDVDELLCVLVEGEMINVPYLDMRIEHFAYLIAWGSNPRAADVRDWFEPPEIASGATRV